MKITDIDAYYAETKHLSKLLLEKQLSREENIVPLLHIMMSPERERETDIEQKRRESACSLLIQICRNRSEKFNDLLLGKNVDVASGAAQILGRSRTRQALEVLTSSLNNVSHPVLNWVIWSVGQFRNSEAVNRLSKFMHHEAETVREATTIAIGDFPGDEVLTLLVSALSDPYAGVRRSAAEAFARRELTVSDVDKLIEPLILALGDHDEHVRSQSANALGYLHDDRVVPALLTALQDESDEVRSFAVKSLGQIGDANAFFPLVECLTDKSWVVRSEAAEALAIIGDDRAIPFLRLRLKDNSDFVRKEVRRAIKSLQV